MNGMNLLSKYTTNKAARNEPIKLMKKPNEYNAGILFTTVQNTKGIDADKK